MKQQIREMTKDEVSIFLDIQSAKDYQVENMFNAICNNEAGGWVLKAIEKRFGVLKINADKKVMIMVLSIGDGVVGRCANYVDDVVAWCRKNSYDSVNLQLFANKIYPVGIPVFN